MYCKTSSVLVSDLVSVSGLPVSVSVLVLGLVVSVLDSGHPVLVLKNWSRPQPCLADMQQASTMSDSVPSAYAMNIDLTSLVTVIRIRFWCWLWCAEEMQYTDSKAYAEEKHRNHVSIRCARPSQAAIWRCNVLLRVLWQRWSVLIWRCGIFSEHNSQSSNLHAKKCQELRKLHSHVTAHCFSTGMVNCCQINRQQQQGTCGPCCCPGNWWLSRKLFPDPTKAALRQFIAMDSFCAALFIRTGSKVLDTYLLYLFINVFHC